MLLVKENFDIWYNEYRKQRAKSEKYVTSRGGKVRDLEVSNYSDFVSDFVSEHADNPNLSGKELARKMAKDETYTVTSSQARAQAEAIATYHGQPVTPGLIARVKAGLTDDDEFWSAVSAKQLELRTSGYGWAEIQVLVGQEYFGSE